MTKAPIRICLVISLGPMAKFSIGRQNVTALLSFGGGGGGGVEAEFLASVYSSCTKLTDNFYKLRG